MKDFIFFVVSGIGVVALMFFISSIDGFSTQLLLAIAVGLWTVLLVPVFIRFIIAKRQLKQFPTLEDDYTYSWHGLPLASDSLSAEQKIFDQDDYEEQK